MWRRLQPRGGNADRRLCPQTTQPALSGALSADVPLQCSTALEEPDPLGLETVAIPEVNQDQHPPMDPEG